MTRKRRRLYLLALVLLGLGTATALTLTAFQDNLAFFYSPTDLATKEPPRGAFRLGGLVEPGSIDRQAGAAANAVEVRFRVTDLNRAVPVVYAGLLPDLFREGQGVVANGTLGADGVFHARELLAKHDENYMPPEVAEALKKSGQWKEPGKPGK